MSATTREVWASLPYRARAALLPDDLTRTGSDLSIWTVERIQATPWTLLPDGIKQAIYDETCCEEIG